MWSLWGCHWGYQEGLWQASFKQCCSGPMGAKWTELMEDLSCHLIFPSRCGHCCPERMQHLEMLKALTHLTRVRRGLCIGTRMVLGIFSTHHHIQPNPKPPWRTRCQLSAMAKYIQKHEHWPTWGYMSPRFPKRKAAVPRWRFTGEHAWDTEGHELPNERLGPFNWLWAKKWFS